jgi:hypothetical protein
MKDLLNKLTGKVAEKKYAMKDAPEAYPGSFRVANINTCPGLTGDVRFQLIPKE